MCLKAKNTKTEKNKKKFTWGLFLTGAALLLISFWFNLATIEYKAVETVFPFRSSGWFFISLIFTTPIAGLFSILFCQVAKKLHKLAWFLMLIISGLLIFNAICYSLPKKQLSIMIGQAAVEKIKIEELYIRDSFNAGLFAHGILLGNKASMVLIKEYRPLKEKTSIPLQSCNMLRYFKEHKFPEIVNIYSDDYSSFYLSPKENKIYFSWRSRGKEL